MDTITPNASSKPRSVKKIKRRFERYKQKFQPFSFWRPPVTVSDVQHLLDTIDALKDDRRRLRARLKDREGR